MSNATVKATTLDIENVDLVLATEWNVSTTTGTDIEGAELSIYRIVPRTPTPDNPFRCEVEYRVKKAKYQSANDARKAAYDMGYLKIYERKTK